MSECIMQSFLLACCQNCVPSADESELSLNNWKNTLALDTSEALPYLNRNAGCSDYLYWHSPVMHKIQYMSPNSM